MQKNWTIEKCNRGLVSTSDSKLRQLVGECDGVGVSEEGTQRNMVED